MKTAATFSVAYEAYIAKGRLESEGIMAEVMNEVSSYTCINAISPIMLMVNDEDFERALAVLSSETKTPTDE